jgi:glycosyltransferase involved in cell wall biosynthesis
MYAAADLVILPSRWEGWGLPVIEAAMAGKPVVAGPYPVLQEIRAAGLTVYDPSEVALVAKALQDPRIAAPMLRANRRVALARFDLPGLTGELHDLAHRARALRAETSTP